MVAALRLLAARWPTDPHGYTRDFLNRQYTPQQIDIADKLINGKHRRVLMRSANNFGKTFFLASIANWHHDQYDPGVVLATAPTQRQLRDLLFKEIRQLRPFPDGLSPRATRMETSPNHFVHGFTARDESGFKGQHEGKLLLLFDEAVGIHRNFWTAGETMFTGETGHGWLAAYNATDTTSYAYQAETTGLWDLVVLNALEHVNILAELRGELPPIPSAVRLKRVMDRIESECEACGSTKQDDTCFEFPVGSNRWYKPLTSEFEIQILGRWPSKAFNSLWSDEIWSVCEKVCEVFPVWPVQIGCDVARFGLDKTAIAVRKGLALIHIETMTHARTNEIADRLRQLCRQYVPQNGRPERVPCMIDDTGGYGAGVVDYPQGFRFIGVNAAEKAQDQNRYPNKRTELWCHSRAAADAGGFVVGTVKVGREYLKTLREEMIAVRYSLDNSNRRIMEGKKHTKERLGRSPDIADAVNLSWYPPIS